MSTPEDNTNYKHLKIGLVTGFSAVLLLIIGVGGFLWQTKEIDGVEGQEINEDKTAQIDPDKKTDQGANEVGSSLIESDNYLQARLKIPNLKQVSASSATDLLTKLREKGSNNWPPEKELRGVTAAEFPEDLAEVSVNERKEIFYRVLAPIVIAENLRLRSARDLISDLSQRRHSLSDEEQEIVEELAEYYRVSLEKDSFYSDLLHRLDEIPVDLAIAQAANESGWGTSRFTRQANNLFGEWTWTQKEGLVPERRAEGQTHRIRVFDSLQRSVRSYFYTLNVGNSYEKFRDMRAKLRENGKQLDGYYMASALTSYSERGQDYVDEIRAMISFNNLDKLNSLELSNE
ncbi:putative Bax protein [Halorhodospira halochloris]|uniref:Bax protein n=1 Tax=Halorhodospira halochloris TaxID=1052 RepID=A0A0X8X6W7_HALHR|nr:glucosaminidase domain-containing protein [Halorhodospira halochloris]MBK1650789.1 hypothetical protein [Halorhodospira halochloris]BAU56714.1 putative Bax protein [Halorhodospira halochloris]